MAAEKGFYGAVVPVRDLAAMREFYSEMLELGEPLLDSNFWVELSLPGGGVLALERRESAVPPQEGQGLAWMMGVADFAKRVKRLEDAQVKVLRPPQEVPGVSCRSFVDPEGNPFTLYDAGKRGSGKRA